VPMRARMGKAVIRPEPGAAMGTGLNIETSGARERLQNR
jgi:hypothetical protein